MRLMLLLAAAGAALLAGPAAAQNRHAAEAAEAIDRTAPAIDRTTQALLNLDIGPILDAADPTRPHHHRTVRDMARRDDPDFERHMRASIYGNAARLRQMSAAIAATEPALRQTLAQFQASIAAAIEGPGMEAPPPPPGDVDDDWDRDQDDDPPPPEPYEE
ncbi:MAG: hypothetical protein E6G92_00450 [Alphaproteobacteria bacterium]|nr:MAG: hypothetical protein E6G92_00450 [Alphaproteobacteria bacterium]